MRAGSSCRNLVLSGLGGFTRCSLVVHSRSLPRVIRYPVAPPFAAMPWSRCYPRPTSRTGGGDGASPRALPAGDAAAGLASRGARSRDCRPAAAPLDEAPARPPLQASLGYVRLLGQPIRG